MPELTILYDGGCPLCVREVRFLSQRDRQRNAAAPMLGFVDIDAPDYNPERSGGIGYREAMGRIHAIEADGSVLRDVAVFRRAYQLVGLGWLYAPTDWPLISPLINALYALWADWRLRLTGRPTLEQLCSQRGGCRRPDPFPTTSTQPAIAPLNAAVEPCPQASLQTSGPSVPQWPMSPQESPTPCQP